MEDHPRPARRGFTLVELLVVIGIIALLISILLPTLSRARASAKQLSCLSRHREVGKAFVFFANDNDGRIVFEDVPFFGDSPPSWIQWGASIEGSWPAKVRPYLGGDTDLDDDGDGLPDDDKPHEFLTCPSLPLDPPFGLTRHDHSHFALNMNLRGTNVEEVYPGRFTDFNWQPKKFVDVRGSAEAALVLDAIMNVNSDGDIFEPSRTVWPEWFTPSDVRYPGSVAPHPQDGEKLNVLFADGHAESVRRSEVPDFDAAAGDGDVPIDPHASVFWYGNRPASVWQFGEPAPL